MAASTMVDDKIERDFLNLVDLCPFLSADRARYNDEAVYAILKKYPTVACLRHSFRCGVKNIHPLPIVVALGGSLNVVQLMVDACPEALNERLHKATRRTLLHYIISEGVDIAIIKYLTAKCCPTLITATDSFGGTPLHLAASYPSSTTSVLRYLLHLYPKGAHVLDNRSQTALHRACKSRAELSKIYALIEANPRALFWKDYSKTTPLGWAERMDHSLSDLCPETVELISMMEELLRIGSSEDGITNEHYTRDDNTGSGDASDDDTDNNEQQQRALDILSRFRTMPRKWNEGIRISFACNRNLISLIDLQLELYPTLLSLLGKKNEMDNYCGIGTNFQLESVYAILLRQPGLFVHD